MRDMLATKFERAAKWLGFNPVPEIDPRQRPRQPVFVSFDGLRVEAVMVQDANYNRRIHRRETLERLRKAREVVTVRPRNEEAASAGTPAASIDRQP